jgi:hypothetical protein
MTPVPLKFTRESFYGFNMTDDEVGPGDYRPLAIEVKHLFESMVADADEKNEELFLTKELDHALRRLLVDPTNGSLNHRLEVSPTLGPHVSELKELLRIVSDRPSNDV